VQEQHQLELLKLALELGEVFTICTWIGNAEPSSGLLTELSVEESWSSFPMQKNLRYCIFSGGVKSSGQFSDSRTLLILAMGVAGSDSIWIFLGLDGKMNMTFSI